jgi:hypothetical protein
MEALTHYNSYCYQPGRYNLFAPHELAEIAAADAEIEADHAARIAACAKRSRARVRRRSINQEIALSRYWREKAAEKSPADADASDRALDIDRIHYTTAATNAQGGTA